MTASPPEALLNPPPLRSRIAAALPAQGEPALVGPARRLPLNILAEQPSVGALAGRSVLVATGDALAAAAALAQLDGLAARLVLCPPDVTGETLGQAALQAGCEAILTDRPDAPDLPALPIHPLDLASERATAPSEPAASSSSSALRTEWALFTSGTSGAPKLVAHTLGGLVGAIAPPADPTAPRPAWATFYDPRRYGGLQMLLRALVGGFSLHLTDGREPLAAFLQRIAAAGVTHVAGTPSHWRRALMSPALAALQPAYVRLSGEIADQAVLDALHARFPHARIVHAYASTEAGVGFEVGDGREGFPASFLEEGAGAVGLQVREGTLRLRSTRAASGYLGHGLPSLKDEDGWVDTGDLVERSGDRYRFLGRRSGVINVGGEKVAPEEVEAVINSCPGVRMSRVAPRASPLLGALVSAEVVLEPSAEPSAARAAILARCRAALAPHKAPASLRIVDALPVGANGKLERRRA